MANYHLNGNGCQKCGVQCTGYTKTAYIKACASGSSVYIFELSKGSELFYKIGISKNIKNRVAGIVSQSRYTPSIYLKFSINPPFQQLYQIV